MERNGRPNMIEDYIVSLRGGDLFVGQIAKIKFMQIQKLQMVVINQLNKNVMTD